MARGARTTAAAAITLDSLLGSQEPSSKERASDPSWLIPAGLPSTRDTRRAWRQGDLGLLTTRLQMLPREQWARERDDVASVLTFVNGYLSEWQRWQRSQQPLTNNKLSVQRTRALLDSIAPLLAQVLQWPEKGDGAISRERRNLIPRWLTAQLNDDKQHRQWLRDSDEWLARQLDFPAEGHPMIVCSALNKDRHLQRSDRPLMTLCGAPMTAQWHDLQVSVSCSRCRDIYQSSQGQQTRHFTHAQQPKWIVKLLQGHVDDSAPVTRNLERERPRDEAGVLAITREWWAQSLVTHASLLCGLRDDYSLLTMEDEERLVAQLLVR